MPAKSESQRRYIYATQGVAFARRHHFDNKGPLPEHVARKRGLRVKKGKP